MYERTVVASACLVRSSLARPPLRPVGRETWWTLPCASCRVPSTRGVFSRTLLWKTGALALSSSFTRGKGRYGHLGVDAGSTCTCGPFPYRSSFLPARSTHLRPFGRVTRPTFPSALGLGTVCLALVPLALPRLGADARSEGGGVYDWDLDYPSLLMPLVYAPERKRGRPRFFCHVWHCLLACRVSGCVVEIRACPFFPTTPHRPDPLLPFPAGVQGGW